MSMLPRPFRNWSTYEGHGGIDYGQPRGTGVPASGPGVIDFSGYYSERGGWAKFIQYDCGCRHGYYHFDREQGLGVGARVDYGTIFAFVGGTGLYSTGPHLHHEVWNGHSSIIKPPAYWNYVNQNSYVGDGTVAGGITLGGFLMALSDEQQSQLFNMVANLYHGLYSGGPSTVDGESIVRTLAFIKQSVGPIARVVDGKPTAISLRQEVADAKTGVLELQGRPSVEVDADDAKAIAEAIASILGAHTGPVVASLSDADVARLATAAADERDRRERERLAAK